MCARACRPFEKHGLASCFRRHHGPEADDGEAGRSQDTPGGEEDDRGGDGRQQQQHHQLPGLCQDDAGEALGRPQAVSKTEGLREDQGVLRWKPCCYNLFEAAQEQDVENMRQKKPKAPSFTVAPL